MILGWSPKAACTSIKQGIMSSLNISVIEGVHEQFFKSFPDVRTNDPQEGYTKILLVRDPIKRFISTILNRSRSMEHLPYPYITTRNMLSMLYDCNMVKQSSVFESCYFSPDIRHHFKQQVASEITVNWDYIYNIDDDINLIFKKISKDLSLQKLTFTELNVSDSVEDLTGSFYGDDPFAYIPAITSKHPDNWLDEDMKKMIMELYKEDFDLLDRCTRI